MDYIHLMGAEQVQSAGSSIRSAADTISSAASTMDDSARHIRTTMCEVMEVMTRLAEALETLNAREAAKEAAPPRSDPVVIHSPSCGYPGHGCTCRAWESSPLG